MKKKLSQKEIFQGKIISLGIKEIIPASVLEKQFSKINVRIINRIPLSLLKNNVPTIAIITPQTLSQQHVTREAVCRQVADNFRKNNVVFLFLADSSSVPSFFKNLAADTDIPVAASKYDRHYLGSLLKALLREKFQETVCVHGVIMEAKGKGVLITGASGIGKTTAALKAITKDYCWVADDVVVIKKNKDGQLIAGGHKKIKSYLHTEVTGIVPVRELLKPERIKEKTNLAAVVEVEKAVIRNVRMIKGEKEILGVKLTCLHFNIPSTGYFSENLLKKALIQLSKDN